MAKTRTQISREHVARIRRKAQAYDLIVQQLEFLSRTEKPVPVDLIRVIVDGAENSKVVQE